MFGGIFKKCFEKYFLVFSCVLENTIKNIWIGHSTCDGLLDMSREKNGRLVTWVVEGGRGRKRETWQISGGVELCLIGGGVELCLIGGERHGLNSSGVDLKFR